MQMNTRTTVTTYFSLDELIQISNFNDFMNDVIEEMKKNGVTEENEMISFETGEIITLRDIYRIRGVIQGLAENKEWKIE